jgi:hypothetical protein
VITAPDGQRLIVRGEHADKTRIILGDVRRGGWALDLHYGKDGQVLLEGDHARRATALIMPKVNSGGASRTRVQTAVDRIESSGDPERFLNQVARTPPPKVESPGWKRKAKHAPRAGGISKLPLETRLAVEMAVNEENERRALEGELTLLELEWKDAEEIAAIADRLGNESVDEQFEALKRRSTT